MAPFAMVYNFPFSYILLIVIQQASSLAHDEDVENDWESEMIKRGARKSETNGGGGGADHLLSATSAAR